MALKTIVKLSSVNNLSDARYGAGMGVSLMGFNLSPSQQGSITADTYKEISDWISGVQLVAEFSSETSTNITNILKDHKADLIQTESGLVIEELYQQSVPLILKISSDDETEIRRLMSNYTGKVSYFLLEQDEPASPISAAVLKELCAAYPVLIGNDVTEKNIDYVLNTIQPAGISLKGGEEIRPGFKDFDEISHILELLEIED
jgi:phosphoribosylanthranilate isomerase